MSNLQSSSTENLWVRLQLHLRRLGVIVERVSNFGRLSVADPALFKICGDEIVNLLCEVRRYRSELEKLGSGETILAEYRAHCAKLAAMRQSALHWLGERSAQQPERNEDLCGSFEALAWSCLASGVLLQEVLQACADQKKPTDDVAAMATWWGDTIPATIPLCLSPLRP
jgi:hypothetical protein